MKQIEPSKFQQILDASIQRYQSQTSGTIGVSQPSKNLTRDYQHQAVSQIQKEAHDFSVMSLPTTSLSIYPSH